MFIGHFGVGFAAKKVDKRPALGTYLMAAQFLDLLWPIFLLLGIERVKLDPGNTAFTPLDFIYYPFSHSLLSVLLWGFLFGLIYFLLKKNLRASIILGLLVLSHWILDLLTHRPDLQIIPGLNLFAGIGLWNSASLTIIVEGTIFIIGVIYYVSATRPLNRKGSIGLWSLVIFLILVYILNIIGPPPENVAAIGYVGLSQWLLIWWAYFIDRNRSGEPFSS